MLKCSPTESIETFNGPFLTKFHGPWGNLELVVEPGESHHESANRPLACSNEVAGSVKIVHDLFL